MKTETSRETGPENLVTSPLFGLSHVLQRHVRKQRRPPSSPGEWEMERRVGQTAQGVDSQPGRRSGRRGRIGPTVSFGKSRRVRPGLARTPTVQRLSSFGLKGKYESFESLSWSWTTSTTCKKLTEASPRFHWRLWISRKSPTFRLGARNALVFVGHRADSTWTVDP